MRVLLTLTILLCLRSFLAAQPCTKPGQTPSTAFPVCGTSVFQQSTVAICSSHNLTVPGCSGNSSAAYQDKNPYWYKFTCYQSGSLGFLISPIDQGDDYDWQLYDITGKDPDDVFKDASLIVTGNWAGTFGNTGASSAGVNFIQCASDPADKKNSFSTMPQLIKGHTYLLLVSHFTDSQSGYRLSFGGGTAVITDDLQPDVKYAEASCGGDVIRVKLNKKMKCSSVAANGSDFYITPGNVPVVSATAINCSNGFDTDSIELQLSSFLGPGSYNLNIKKGTDANTILDYCDRPIPEASKVDFTVYPLQPTPMDSMAVLDCKPQSLRLIFRKPMLCSSVAADGSDFIITGNYPVSVKSALGTCTNGTKASKEIIITLSQPLYQAGNFVLGLRTGIDGNTIFDECGQETPSGSFLNFSVKDTVNADFTYQINYGCSIDTVNFFHPGGNSVSSWQWDLDENNKTGLQNPQALYHQFNSKRVSLAVSNGFCSDTSLQTIQLDNFLKAGFTSFEDACPNEPTQFTNTSQGRIINYSWEFGDGGLSSQESPSHIYSVPFTSTSYVVRCTVTDNFGCESTAQKMIKVYSSCYLAVPTAFTPNRDGKNDFLAPLNAIKAERLIFKIYNRWGQLMYETRNWKQGWDGSFNGIPQATGVYVWLLTYVDRDTKQPRQMKGTSVLIR